MLVRSVRLNSLSFRRAQRPGICFLLLSFFLAGILPSPARAQQSPSVAASIQKIIDRPEFKHANFGIEFYDLATNTVVYSLNPDKLFTPASTTKLLTEGTVLAKFGKDFRFHTAIYRTGPIDKKGRLKGDLILVASGDPNLSNRMQPDNTLAFVDEDHSYGGPALPGDPLTLIKSLAKQVYDKGVRRVDGRILVDTSLFPDGPREGGTDVVMSSIMVNDNVLDIVAKPGAKTGDPISVATSPQTGYAHFTVHASTTAAGTPLSFSDPEFISNPDGSVTIVLSGSLPLGIDPQTVSIGVPAPTLFAQWVLRDSLTAEGIQLKSPVALLQPDFPSLTHS